MLVSSNNTLTQTLLKSRRLSLLLYNLHFVDILFLIGILIIASAARFWGLDTVGFNNDEAVYSGQGASLAGYTEFYEHFSIFRAHPLLFQGIVAITFLIVGLSDAAARSVAATFGVLTVAVTYILARILFRDTATSDHEISSNASSSQLGITNRLGSAFRIRKSRAIAISSSMVVALLPYHVIVSRQALVDVPFSFFFAVTILMMSLFCLKGNRKWLYLVGLSAGLSFLSKEVGFLTLAASLLFLFLTRQLSKRNLLAVLFTFFLAISPFLIFLAVSGTGASTGTKYFDWQLSRTPNHPADFYLETIVGTLGYVLVALVIISLSYELLKYIARGIDERNNQYYAQFMTSPKDSPRGGYGDGSSSHIYSQAGDELSRKPDGGAMQDFSPKFLLAVFFIAPFLFFQFWPTKGYHYLHYGVVPLVLIGVPFLFEDWIRKYVSKPRLVAIAILAFAIFTTDYVIFGYFIPSDPVFIAGAGGLPKAREAAQWLEQNSRPDSVVMTVGPTMGNVIKFYSHRDVVALAIPKSGPHNPAYSPIINPDLSVRSGEVNYIVYDMYSAARTQNLADRITYFAEKYNAAPVHIEYEKFSYADGTTQTQPVIIIFENFR